jgi:hypothetical protein
MQLRATTLDGEPLGEITLVRDAAGRALLDGQQVVALRPLGRRVVLIVGSRQFCVLAADYWKVIGAGGAGAAEDTSSE